MNTDDKPSPRIEQVAWGHIRIAGIGSGKDFKLWPGGGREWDWNETGTRHDPGIQPADIEELLERGCRVIVLSRGMLLRLRTCQQTLALIESRGARVLVAETREAVRLYNELAASGEAVGGLFHSTC